MQIGKQSIRNSSLPIELQEKLLFYVQLGYWPDFDKPRTFCEKLHFWKLRMRDPQTVELSDKIKVRDYVSANVGEEYLVPLKYTGPKISSSDILDSGDNIVVKRNDDSGSAYIIEENSSEESRKALGHVSKKGHGGNTNEWWYKEISPGFLVEEKIGSGHRPIDYKFFVFRQPDAKPYFFTEVIEKQFTGEVECGFFDEEMRPLYHEGSQVTYRGSKLYSSEFPAPREFAEMKRIALKLAEDFSFVRVDLYADSGKVYFGELTFCPSEGRSRLKPRAFERHLGDLWHL